MFMIYELKWLLNKIQKLGSPGSESPCGTPAPPILESCYLNLILIIDYWIFVY